MVEERSRGFICLFIFFFVSLFFDKFSKFSSKSAKIVARTRANVNEDRRDPRDTLPFSQQPHVYHPRLSLGLLLLLSMRIFNIFPLFIYFFLSRVSCYFRFFFFFLTRLDNSRVQRFCVGQQNSSEGLIAGVRAAQLVSRVVYVSFVKRHITLTT